MISREEQIDIIMVSLTNLWKSRPEWSFAEMLSTVKGHSQWVEDSEILKALIDYYQKG